jgi:hypothetical protein
LDGNDKELLDRYEELMQSYRGYMDIVDIVVEKLKHMKKEIVFLEEEISKKGYKLKEIKNAD